jgi:hypothetical protein
VPEFYPDTFLPHLRMILPTRRDTGTATPSQSAAPTDNHATALTANPSSPAMIHPTRILLVAWVAFRAARPA